MHGCRINWQSNRGWTAVLKGADLENGEGGFISWMPLRHYTGRSGMMEALSMWREYGLIECTDARLVMHRDVVHDDAGWW